MTNSHFTMPTRMEPEPPQPLNPSPQRRFPSPTPHIDTQNTPKSPIPYIV
ncbi:MAG TPA: hypothetical protein VMD05_05385 [Candidatus Nanoarchaeia archaeon]|nr:hypothetical protein [Candidatus Nanoarchaeia archaeon]